ncbi:arginase family protein [Carboxydochorda subterranea]|uniref:Arginase family protein n=1 Tax=Carboxydichorda subterranea TaxID=3109565 RepID=A0ABZ1BTG2_9FIRM|nr:arginase family protein [Limnochorda sp. L945t]WRP16105.1 arginase family protein [Limnochorda sp. L945t]
MLRGVSIVETDGSVRVQERLVRLYAPRDVVTRPPAGRFRYFMPHSELSTLASELRPARGDVAFLGAGDFHHLTAALLRAYLAAGPAGGPPLALILLDAHPEWSPAPAGYLHCGSWLPEVLAMPELRAVAVLGVGRLEARGLLQPRIVQAIRPAAREGRLRVYPARRSTVQELHAAVWWPDPLVSLEEGLDAVVADVVAFVGEGPVYLSIDKDVVRPEELPGTWGDGEAGQTAVLAMVSELALALPVAGADVTGEYVASLLPQQDPAVKLHEIFNLRLLAALLAGRPVEDGARGRPTARAPLLVRRPAA